MFTKLEKSAWNHGAINISMMDGIVNPKDGHIALEAHPERGVFGINMLH